MTSVTKPAQNKFSLGYAIETIKYLYQSNKKRKKLLQEIRSRNNVLFKDEKELGLILGATAYIHPEEIPAQVSYAQKAVGPIVEIGAAFGASALVYLSAKHENAVHSIDPFVTDSMITFRATERKCRENVTKGLKRLNKKERLRLWTIHPQPSYEVVTKWSTPIGLIFIDGDHHYKAVKKDFIDWFPHVILNGYILIHDSRRIDNGPADKYNRGWQGPTQLAEELRQNPKVKLIEEAHSLTIWQKIVE